MVLGLVGNHCKSVVILQYYTILEYEIVARIVEGHIKTDPLNSRCGSTALY